MSHYDNQYEEEYNMQNEKIRKEWEEYCQDAQIKPLPHEPQGNDYIDGIEEPTSNVKPISLAVNGKVLGEANKSSQDSVDSPSHYQFFPDLEAIELIAMSMSIEEFYGYCLGNRMKYRLRAGNKGNAQEDLAKSDKYIELYNDHVGLCRDFGGY